MYCENCGTLLPDDSVFCANCGTKLKVMADQPIAPAVNPVYDQPVIQKKKAPAWIFIVAGIAIAVIIAVLVIVFNGNKETETDKKDSDIKAMLSYMTAVDVICADSSISSNPVFHIKVSYGNVMLSVSTPGSSSESAYLEAEWSKQCGAYSIKSNDFRAIEVTYDGQLQSNGRVGWRCIGNDAMLRYSSEFAAKFN